MVDALDVYLNLVAVNLLHAHLLLDHSCDDLLGAEHLVAAAKALDFREYLVHHLDAHGHGVGVVDDPGFGAVLLDGLRELNVVGEGAQGADNAAGAHGVAYRLVDAVFFGGVYVGFHLVKGAGEDGEDDEIAAGECVLQGGDSFIGEVALYVLPALEAVADDFVVFCRLHVNVIQFDRAAEIGFNGKVAHQVPGPPAGAAADIGDFDFLLLHIHIPPKMLYFKAR